MAREIRERAEELAKELVGNVQFYETQERWGCFDIAKGWPEVIKAPHTKHGRLKRILTASLVPKIEAALRLSEDAARSSEALPGVGTAVESNTADEKASAETGGEKAAQLKATDSPHSSMAEPFPYKGQVAGSSPVAATILNELVSAIVTYLVEMSADNLDVLDKAVDKSQAWLIAGSAETGGEKAAPQKCHALDLPEGFLGQRCGKCDSLFPDSNFKFCSECGAHLVHALEEK